jgi:hypothetical protein
VIGVPRSPAYGRALCADVAGERQGAARNFGGAPASASGSRRDGARGRRYPFGMTGLAGRATRLAPTAPQASRAAPCRTSPTERSNGAEGRGVASCGDDAATMRRDDAPTDSRRVAPILQRFRDAASNRFRGGGGGGGHGARSSACRRGWRGQRARQEHQRQSVLERRRAGHPPAGGCGLRAPCPPPSPPLRSRLRCRKRPRDQGE